MFIFNICLWAKCNSIIRVTVDTKCLLRPYQRLTNSYRGRSW